jgi:hypothetical protein
MNDSWSTIDSAASTLIDVAIGDDVAVETASEVEASHEAIYVSQNEAASQVYAPWNLDYGTFQSIDVAVDADPEEEQVSIS